MVIPFLFYSFEECINNLIFNAMSDEMKCPKCKSTYLDINKKGFGAGKALAGAVLTGGVGLLAGFIGSKKIKATCLKCGHKFDTKDGFK